MASVSGKEAILDRLIQDFSAASSGDTRQSHLRTWTAFHREWFGASPEVIPVTIPGMLAVSAMFKKAGYRSFGNYLSSVKALHVQSGHDWSQQHEQAARWCTRSVLRGIGPARQSAPLDLLAVHALNLGPEPVCDGGPVDPAAMFTLVAYFLLREIEASLAVVSSWTVRTDIQIIIWLLPASKTDPLALGCTRSWGCLCGGTRCGVPCPYHCALDHLTFLQARFGPEAATGDFPLFPTRNGEVAAKDKVTLTFEALAAATGQATTVNGVRVVGGHSGRVTGAQFLAGLGLEIPKVMLLARWASSVVYRYIAEAPLLAITTEVKRLLQTTLVQAESSEVLESLRERIASLEQAISNASVTLGPTGQAEEVAPLEDANSIATEATFVLNEKNGKMHRCLRPGDGSGLVTRSACGWKFLAQPYRLAADLSHVQWPDMCEKCLGPWRDAAMSCLPVTAQSSGSEVD